ncbi:MAG: sugar phosphate isomerase/epimerase [Thaumarchaeota archaeon]|nr:sugar phosphate isomerase/epimerase [Nitrososphaerota archaeon]
MDLAFTSGLSGVELPAQEYLRGMSEGELARVRRYGEERELYFVLDGGVVDVPVVRGLIDAATALGARTIRVTASSILCGDRSAMAAGWSRYIAEIADRLRSLRGRAEERGISIAVENHQDLTSEEMAALCAAVGSENVGVALDSVNSLAVVEDPLEFARRLGPLIKHVHLKDYRIHSTPEGYRLVRCAIGAGVLDVSGLFSLLHERAPEATVAIELAALEARHVRFLEDGYWSGYPSRRVEQVLPVLRLRESRSRPPGEDWRTPWEVGASHDALSAYEMGQFHESVSFLRKVDGGATR